MNEHHDFPVMFDKDHGTGRYLASLDVFHELHCVVSTTTTKSSTKLFTKRYALDGEFDGGY